MRRLMVLMAGVGLLHAAAGCKHLAGICDCAPPVQPCCIYGLYPAHPVTVVPAGAVERPAEVVPETPKEPLTKERIGYPRDM